MNIAATSSLSLRMFYHSYSSVASGATRKAASTGTLSMADASALRNAVRKLEEYDFESATKDQIQEKLQAFTDTMNNAITSANKYGAGDTSVRNAVSKLKRLNNEYSSELQKIGISVDKTGTMSLYDKASKTYSAEKFSKFFDNDSKYLKEVYDAAKRITRKVDVRL